MKTDSKQCLSLDPVDLRQKAASKLSQEQLIKEVKSVQQQLTTKLIIWQLLLEDEKPIKSVTSTTRLYRLAVVVAV